MSVFILLTIITVCLGGLFWLLYKTHNEAKAALRLLNQVEKELRAEREQKQKLYTELSELNDKFQYQILTDPLTKLPSRQVFEDRLVQTLNQSKRYKLTFGVLFLDIDEFNLINNALGYDIGNELLVEVAKRASSCIRQVDTISRFSGDDFVLLLPQLAKAESAAYVAQRLLEIMTRPIIIKDQELFITASIGIAVYPNDGEEWKIILNNADNALHQAKLRGRNTYQFYQQEMQSLGKRELILNSSLRNPNVYNEFILYYQPQIDIETNKIICMESFLKWQHPLLGSISFVEFLKLAENTKKINEFGEWMLRACLDQINDWKNEKVFPEKISIRVSAHLLEDSHFIYKISQILQEYQVAPNSLVLQLAEDGFLNRNHHLQKTFNMLHHLGVLLAIENFGTAPLSMSALERFPVQYLKINKCFIENILQDPESQKIVKMILSLAKSSNIKVIADGVETEEQKAFLQQLGCQIMEGKLWGGQLLPHELSKVFTVT